MPALRFPVYDLDSSIEVAKTLHDHGGTASTHELASYLGYKSAHNGAFLNRVAAARLFELVVGSGGAIGLTPRAYDILQPDYPETAESARLSVFMGVPLFQAFLEKYEGRPLPPLIGIQNALTQFGVPPKSVKHVAARLLDSAAQAGLFKASPDRSKMIRPSILGVPPSQRAAASPIAEPGYTPPVSPATSRYPKLIEGALEQLPDSGVWNEAELEQWLKLMEISLRMVYRIPKGG
jgi:hypothetical protein